MVINMLRAISKMLELTRADKPNESFERVMCAKIMLNEIIKGMEPGAPTKVCPTSGDKVGNIPPKLKPPTEPPEGTYLVTRNNDRTLKQIRGLPLDAKVSVDGKVMTHKEAIGTPFKEGKILG